ncbi:MAG: hypothetical protein HY962_07090 [Ignavibacteriae bacterium]|nr:hypothetical protein [Ignavibacteriota bacterium]
MSAPSLFLPYQRKWLDDTSRIKIAEKSRRIGWTYAQSWEDVRDQAQGLYPAVWFSSADESAAREYIIYCGNWARALDIVARDLGQVVIDHDRDIKAFSIEFTNGSRIHALSSNPKGFRSKGGKVILDEFAWHDDAPAMWAAARPTITWGFPLRVFSTHNGRNSLFNRFVERSRRGELPWSLHSVDIQQAVADGLVDKIMRRPTTEEERAQWIAGERASVGDESVWLQEYCCQPQDESTAFIPYDMYASCEAPLDLLWNDGESRMTEEAARALPATGDLYLGYDVARRRHLAVIYVVERTADILVTRLVIAMHDTPFRQQRAMLWPLLAHPRLRRACIDSSGMGTELAEDAVTDYGRTRVEAVNFTNPVKADLASRLRNRMEDRRLLVPPIDRIRESFHSIRRTVTAAGNVRFDAAEDDLTGHGDDFWAAALAVHASDGGDPLTPPQVHGSVPSDAASLLSGYID